MKLTEEAKMLNLIEMGQRIQRARIEGEIKAIDMAAILNIGRDAYSRIENGRAMISADKLYILSQYLEKSADYFLSGQEEDIALDKIIQFMKGREEHELDKALKLLILVFS